MPAELLAALVALALAGVQLATVELRIRAARRERQELDLRVADVQRRVGADRRVADAEHRVH